MYYNITSAVLLHLALWLTVFTTTKTEKTKKSQEYKNQSNLKPTHMLLINITTLKLDNIRSVFVSLRFTWMYTLKYYNINAPFYVNLKTKKN